MIVAHFLRRWSSTSQVVRKSIGCGVGEVGGKLYVDIDGTGAKLIGDSAVHTAVNLGTKNGSTVAVTEYGFGGFLHQTVFTLTATPMTVADATAGGGVKIYTFPEGAITVLGGSFSLVPTTTSTIASTLKAGVTIEIGVGSASAGAAALTTTEEDYIDGATGPTSTVINVAPAAIVGGRVAAPGCLDGHAAAKTVNVNIGVPTATDIDGDATVTITGTITLLWLFGGDV